MNMHMSGGFRYVKSSEEAASWTKLLLCVGVKVSDDSAVNFFILRPNRSNQIQ